MVLERAREGLGRDLDNLSEESRLLREAREELARYLASSPFKSASANANEQARG